MVGASASKAQGDVAAALQLAAPVAGGWRVPVRLVSAQSGQGIDELIDLLAEPAALLAREHRLASPRETAKTRAFVLYDHEEVGSQSASGARSDFLGTLLSRLSRAGCDDALPRALSRSLLVSADMAHGVHPNYPDKHDKLHRPMLGRGPVIKVNANQSYATDAQGAAAFTRACQAEQLTPA